MPRLGVLGSGGHALSLVSLISGLPDRSVVALLETDDFFDGLRADIEILGIPVLRQVDAEKLLIEEMVIGVGQIRDSSPREKLYKWCIDGGFRLPNVISASAIVSPHCTISAGVQVFPGAVIGPKVEIGETTIINSGSIIEHGVRVGAFTHVSTGVVLNGDVWVGSRVFIGSGSVIRNGVRIADNSFIPMGSVVTNDIGTT